MKNQPLWASCCRSLACGGPATGGGSRPSLVIDYFLFRPRRRQRQRPLQPPAVCSAVRCCSQRRTGSRADGCPRQWRRASGGGKKEYYFILFFNGFTF